MAFLDNSGDIILDAVLTEDGRKLMAQGNFQIVKFALGDDEINYGLYDTGHPSGSAYYDLEILQTPVLEAVTAINANINYGLLSIPNPNLLYMPSVKRNQKVANATQMRDKVYYMAYNDGTTYDALVSAFGGVNGGGDKQVLLAGQRDGTSIVLETGIDTAEIAATQANKQTFVSSQGLADTAFDISVDSRFINTVLGPGPGDQFQNSPGSGEAKITTSLRAQNPNLRDKMRKHYSKATVRAVSNNVVKRTNDTKSDTSISEIKGPRASATFLNFDTTVITDEMFKQHGSQGKTISGATGTYSFIDTMVKVENQIGVTEQIPIRIIKKDA